MALNCSSCGVDTTVVVFNGGGEVCPCPGGRLGGDLLMSSTPGGGGREKSDESEGSLSLLVGPSMSLESPSLVVELMDLSLIHI